MPPTATAVGYASTACAVEAHHGVASLQRTASHPPAVARLGVYVVEPRSPVSGSATTSPREARMSAHHSLPLLLLPLVAFGCSRDGPTSPQDRAPPAARSAARASAHQRIVVGHDRARCGHADFASIQAAVDAADPGETILVHPDETVERSFMVDYGTPQTTFSTSWPGSTVDMTLVSPSGRRIDNTTTATDVSTCSSPITSTSIWPPRRRPNPDCAGTRASRSRATGCTGSPRRWTSRVGVRGKRTRSPPR